MASREQFISASDEFARLDDEPRQSRVVSRPPPAPVDEKAAVRQALTDLQAAQTRVQRDAERAQAETRAQLIADFLPVLDNLDRTLLAAAGEPDQGLVAGVRMVRDQFEQVLLRQGIERIEAIGRPFDPREHEAIAMEDVEPARRGRVASQVAAGYRFAGKVLRPAKVVVGRAVPVRSFNDWPHD